MLNAIRVAAANWLGRAVLTVIMGLLIVSFAIWGIGDIFRGGVNRTLATVGDVKISADEYRNALNAELRRIQMQVRRAVTMEEARAFGLDRNLLNRKLDEAALTQEAGKLGLALAPELVLGSIMDAPDFRTAGQFDRNKLAEALSQSGLTEKEFVKLQEQHLLRLELYNGLLGGLAAPTALLQAVHTYRNNTREVAYITLDGSKLPAPAPADEAAMTAYYEAHKAEFRTVETRKATLIVLAPKDFAGNTTLSEDELKAAYAAGVLAGKYGTPERRTLQRVLFDTEAEAKAAAEKLKGGTPFETLLAERKLNASDVDFGAKTRAGIGDSAQRDAVFAAKEGDLVGPFKDPFGMVLFRIGKIEAARTPPFEQVKDQVSAEAAVEKLAKDSAARTKFEAATKAIEDQKVAGRSLAEAAKAAGVPTVQIPALDRNGGNGAGASVEVPGGADTVASIFASDVGLDNEHLTLKDGTSVWYEVNAVEPARDRSLDDVRADVARRLEAQARDKALLEQANALIKRLDGGETLDKLAQSLGLPVQGAKGIKRGQREATLGGSGVDRAFSGPLGKAVTAPAANGTARLVLVPTKSDTPPFDPASLDRAGVTRQLAQGTADDVMSEYTGAVRRRLGVSINQPLLNQTLGQAAN